MNGRVLRNSRSSRPSPAPDSRSNSLSIGSNGAFAPVLVSLSVDPTPVTWQHLFHSLLVFRRPTTRVICMRCVCRYFRGCVDAHQPHPPPLMGLDRPKKRNRPCDGMPFCPLQLLTAPSSLGCSDTGTPDETIVFLRSRFAIATHPDLPRPTRVGFRSIHSPHWVSSSACCMPLCLDIVVIARVCLIA